MFTETEINILKEFIKGKKIEDHERDLIYRLCPLGLTRIGYDDEDGFHETAKLSSLGKRMVKRQIILSRPISRFFYNFFHHI